jgi:tRNA 2-thiouridine synthesizing protein A
MEFNQELDARGLKGASINPIFVIASEAKQSRNLDISTFFLDRHVASLLAMTINRSALNCPLPILRTKKAFGTLSAGQVLKVVSTDPGSVKDMQAFAKQTGNELLSSAAAAGEFVFYLKRH